jgi:hypothetical protein
MRHGRSDSSESSESLQSLNEDASFISNRGPCRCKCSDQCNLAIKGHFTKNKDAYINGLVITGYASLSLFGVACFGGIIFLIVWFFETYSRVTINQVG